MPPNIGNKQFTWILELISCINRNITMAYLNLNLIDINGYVFNKTPRTSVCLNIFYANCYFKLYRQLEFIPIYSYSFYFFNANIIIYNLYKPRVYNKKRYRRFNKPELYTKNPLYLSMGRNLSLGYHSPIISVQINKPYKKQYTNGTYYVRYVSND